MVLEFHHNLQVVWFGSLFFLLRIDIVVVVVAADIPAMAPYPCLVYIRDARQHEIELGLPPAQSHTFEPIDCF